MEQFCALGVRVSTLSTVSTRWYLWDGGCLALGKAEWGVIPPHSHHAIQIVVAIDGEMAIKGARGDWCRGRGIIVRPDVEHSYDGKGALGAMIGSSPAGIPNGSQGWFCSTASLPRRSRAFHTSRPFTIAFAASHSRYKTGIDPVHE